MTDMTVVELTARTEAMGLSSKALAEVLGIAERTVRRWTHGEKQPSSWDWIEQVITAMEDYHQGMIDALVDQALEVYDDTGEAALVTYRTRGTFYRWHPEAREQKWPGGEFYGVPVELHRTAVALAARKLRTRDGIADAVTITAAPELI